MSNAYTRFLSKTVPQTEQVDPRQKQNNAGGFSFTVNDTTRLERFLILGTDGGTYYVNERDLTKQNIDFLLEFARRDPITVMNIIRDVSVNGRAYRNSSAIFATAVVLKVLGELPPEQIVKTALPSDVKVEGVRLISHRELHDTARKLVSEVCRTATHLFEFAQYVELLGGWGRAKRAAVAAWYTSKSPDQLAYQAVKYRQRNGWTHRDLFRLSHPVGVDQRVGSFILSKPVREDLPEIIRGFIIAQDTDLTSVNDVLRVLDQYPNLPWEALPTQFLKEPKVWKKLFYNGQLKGQALVRNITRLARIGAFNDMVFTRDYANSLVDEDMIRKTRLHPVNYLNALVVHTEGQVQRQGQTQTWYGYNTRKKDWTESPVIKDALNEGFHLSFKHIEPANKRTLIGLDISSSMSNAMCNGLDLMASQASAAMAMTIARSEPYYRILGFARELRDMNISPGDGLTEVLRKVRNQTFGCTDCSLPMVWAKNNKAEIDTFMVITDNETWYGNVHPHIALEQYRQASGIDARLIVAGVAATEFSIANPTDTGMLDCVGMDSNAPKVMADFSRGSI